MERCANARRWSLSCLTAQGSPQIPPLLYSIKFADPSNSLSVTARDAWPLLSSEHLRDSSTLMLTLRCATSMTSIDEDEPSTTSVGFQASLLPNEAKYRKTDPCSFNGWCVCDSKRPAALADGWCRFSLNYSTTTTRLSCPFFAFITH